MPSSSTVLVVGATGHLGRELVKQLRARGRPVRASTRDPRRAQDLQQPGVEIVRADLRDRASLERACDGVDAVVASAHGLLGKGTNNPRTVDLEGHRSLIDVAKMQGIRHFVYVSAMSIRPDHPIEFFRYKYETERYLEASGLSYTIVRGAAFMEMINSLMGDRFLKSGKMMIVGKGTVKSNAVSVRDVARFVIHAVDDSRLHGRLVEVGGPEDLSASDMADVYGQVTGRPVKKTHVPVGLLRTLRPAVGLFSPVGKRIIEMSLKSATQGFSCDMDALKQEFPGELTRFEDVVQDWYANRTT